MDSVKRSARVQKSDDEDLGVLLYKSGQSLKNLSFTMGRGLRRVGIAILFTILFFMKNILWLLLGTVVGLLYGIYLLNTTGTRYYSAMTVKANFNSATALYNTMDYLNALVATGQTDKLASIFGITPKEASRLQNFVTEPVKSEIIISDLYKNQFLNNTNTAGIRQDTFWVRTIDYKDFKESLTKYDFPYQSVYVESSNPSIFSKLQNGIIAHVSNNPLLQDIKSKQLKSNSEEEQLLAASIQKLDSLRIAYNQRLMKSDNATSPAGNQLTVMESPGREQKPPELALYDKMIQISDDLKRARARAATEKDIIEILSPFNPVGRKISFLRQSVTQYALTGFIVTLVILLFISLYKYLMEFEKSQNLKRQAGARAKVN
jgi:hypothetical protein